VFYCPFTLHGLRGRKGWKRPFARYARFSCTRTTLHGSAKSCRRRFSCTSPAKSAEKFAERCGKLPPIATPKVVASH